VFIPAPSLSSEGGRHHHWTCSRPRVARRGKPWWTYHFSQQKVFCVIESATPFLQIWGYQESDSG
jgi:hypothetical protein